MSKNSDELPIIQETVLDKIRREKIEKENLKIQEEKSKYFIQDGSQSLVQQKDKNIVEKGQEINEVNSRKIDKFRLSYIEDYEEEDAKRLIQESLGFEPIRTIMWQVAIKVYVREEDIRQITTDDGRKISIYLPESATAHDKFVNCVGLVISMGPSACKGPAFEEPLYMKVLRLIFGRWMKPTRYPVPFKIGDWVLFDRNSGPQVNYRGVPVTITEDKYVRAVVADPTYVSRY